MPNNITPEQRDLRKRIALINIKDKGMKALALAGFVEDNPSEGELNKVAVDQFKYLPAMTKPTKQVGTLVYASLLGSRTNGKRYSGNVSELSMINKAAEIYGGSLLSVNVGDLMELAGSKVELTEEQKGKYIADLPNKDEVVANYMSYFISSGVAEARKDMSKASLKGLEKAVLNPSDNSNSEE